MKKFSEVFDFRITPFPGMVPFLLLEKNVGRLPINLSEKRLVCLPTSLKSFNGCFTTDCVHLVDSVDYVDCVDNVSGRYFKKSFDYRKLEEMLVAYS